MAELDQTARFAFKVVPEETRGWLLPDLAADLGFGRWLDTETIAFPGEPRRRCDTVAELVSRGGKAPPWAVVLEVEARPRSTILDRLLEYLARLMRKLRHGPHRRDRYQLAAVLLVLTGRQRDLEFDMQLPGTDLVLRWKVRVVNLSRQSAAATLERIAGGELGRSILSWVPLMAGGGEEAVLREWLRLARDEPNSQRRSDYAGLALVLAERAGCLPAWKKALEGWNMWESQVIREWKKEAQREGHREGHREGRVEEKRGDLLKVLRSRFKNVEVPADVAQAIQQATDLEVLSGWFEAALEVDSLEAFGNLLQPAPPPPSPPKS